MSYVPHTDTEREEMLRFLGIESLDDLFAHLPKEALAKKINIGQGLCESDLLGSMENIARRNRPASELICFAGGGAYDHFIPAVVDFVAGRSEFYTANTPYQPEASQGTLQAIFEYQTLITQLTGMDVSNASLYDGGSAAAEAVLMARSTTNRPDRVVVLQSVHPEYREVIATYLTNLDAELATVPTPEGTVRPEALAAAVDHRTACVVVQHPNFFGCLEDVRACARIAHEAGAVFIVAVDPISLGLLARPSDYGADIVVAEGQSLGNPISFGGPYLGILACREPFLRRLPGRLVGQTVDRRGNRCWVLTFQTREQHIRREKATSNICTNQGLLALRAAVYLASMGPQGMRSIAELCVRKANYALGRITSAGAFRPAFDRPIFKEFAVRALDGKVDARIERALGDGILAGVPLGRWYPD
ncbi:MAG: aminomethyl-transferring glycine dehydrogenase subunit GcvPA, partial [Planctomycetota bacterium]|nr:aminomethyl-transferring glycine dehydrogenase subunit GcvPA [Planctomycetota bacterium]